MYDNRFDLCDCPIFNCDCGGGVQSYFQHYKLVLSVVRPKRVFEWGPGENTRMALQADAEVFAIESLLKWVAPLPTDHQRLAVLVTPIDAASYLSLHGKEDSDLFFVDARRRAECLDLVRQRAKPEAVVCLHDAQRKRYNASLQRFHHVVFLTRAFAVASMSPLPAELLGKSSRTTVSGLSSHSGSGLA